MFVSEFGAVFKQVLQSGRVENFTRIHDNAWGLGASSSVEEPVGKLGSDMPLGLAVCRFLLNAR